MRDSYEQYAESKEIEVEDMIGVALEKQSDSWNGFVKSAILTMFLSPVMNTAFFSRRNALRKRSNLSFDDRLLLKAPCNIKLRMPVTLNVYEGWVEACDPYGKMKIKVEKQPDYELEENKIYILTLVKKFPMYPYEPVLEETANGVECHLKPTTLSLQEKPEEDSDYKYLAELPSRIETESEAVDIITQLQNIYRLKDYYVERKDSITIVVEGKEDTFIVSYSTRCHCIEVAIYI